MEISPRKLLQMNGIEAAPDDPRTTEEIVQYYIERGIITVVLDSTLEVPDNTVNE